MATTTATRPAARAKESRLEELQLALTIRTEERDKLVARIEDSRVREHEAVAESLQKEPRKNAYATGLRALKLKIDAAGLEEKLADVEKEISGLEPLVREEEARAREHQLGELRAQLFTLNETEELLYRQGGEILSEWLDLWSDLCDCIEARDLLYGESIHGGALSSEDDEGRREFKQLLQGPVTPVSPDISAFIARLIDATTDREYRLEGGHRTDLNNRLPSLVPDLSSKLRTLSVSGAVDTR